MDIETTLTEQEQLFCDIYLSNGFKSTDAYRLAGCTDKNTNGNKLLNRDDIKDYLLKRLLEKKEGLIIKQDELLGYLSSCIRGTETDTQAFILRFGNRGKFEDKIEEIELRIKHKDRLKAAEIMTKIYNLMDSMGTSVDKIVINNNVPLKNGDPLNE